MNKPYVQAYSVPHLHIVNGIVITHIGVFKANY